MYINDKIKFETISMEINKLFKKAAKLEAASIRLKTESERVRIQGARLIPTLYE